MACVQLALQDTMGWTPANRHDERPGGYGRTSQDSRSGPHGAQSRFDNDLRDDRREGGTREWQRDNGWEGRRQSTAGQSWDDPRGWSSSHGESSNREDRQWEPSASWQPSRRDGGSSSNSNQKNQNSGKSKSKNKGSKKGGSKQQQQQSQPLQHKRSWRDDDSQLNKCVSFGENVAPRLFFLYSWTRREPSSSKRGGPASGKRRHHHSNSPGRSRSPADSYYSRRSYRSRSRSFDTPKRRRRDDSPPPRGGRSPAYSDRQRGRDPRRDRRYSRSPPSSPRSISSRGRDRDRKRYRSTSSYSRSRSRSPTQSPRERPKAVHRLPPATSIKDIPISVPKFRNGQKKGKNKNSNGKLADVRDVGVFQSVVADARVSSFLLHLFLTVLTCPCPLPRHAPRSAG